MTQKNDEPSKIAWVMGHLDFGSSGGGGVRKKNPDYLQSIIFFEKSRCDSGEIYNTVTFLFKIFNPQKRTSEMLKRVVNPEKL